MLLLSKTNDVLKCFCRESQLSYNFSFSNINISLVYMSVYVKEHNSPPKFYYQYIHPHSEQVSTLVISPTPDFHVNSTVLHSAFSSHSLNSIRIPYPSFLGTRLLFQRRYDLLLLIENIFSVLHIKYCPWLRTPTRLRISLFKCSFRPENVLPSPGCSVRI